jgi:hypothetical protein
VAQLISLGDAGERVADLADHTLSLRIRDPEFL